jgi:hypothetical protein
VTALSCVVLLAAAAVPSAGAGSPTHFTEQVDMTFFAPLTSAVCGFPVFVTQTGTADVTLWYGDDGTTVVQEADWSLSLTTTLTAPTQGTSFSYPGGGKLPTDYPDGATLGKPAIATFTGSTARSGTIPPRAAGSSCRP